jgi:hypothetical protein
MAIKNRTIGIPRAGIIRLGSPKGQNSPGRNLNYFRFDTEYFTPEQLEKAMGSKEPKEMRIKFPRIDKDDEKRSLDFIFDASYKAYKSGSLFCKGDGESAMRAVKKGELEQVACTCSLLTGNNPICKQRGDLKVIITNLPFLGFFHLGTSSWNSINSIESVIDMYYKLLGEKFWMTEFILFKEEAMLKGHRQYVMRLKVAPEFIAHLPTGGDVPAMMMFEDDEEQAPEIQLPPENDSGTSQAAVNEPEPEAETSEPETVQTTLEEDTTSESPPPDMLFPDEGTPPNDMPDLPSSEVPAEPTEQNTEAAVPTTPVDEPAAEAVPSTPSEPEPPVETPVQPNTSDAPRVDRVATPQRRSKEAQLKLVCKEFARMANEIGKSNWEAGEQKEPFVPGFAEDDPNAVLAHFAGGRTIEDLADSDVTRYIGEIRDSDKALEANKIDPNDIPF